VTNASDVSVDIVDVSDPASPVRLKRLDLSPYGDEVTSVAVGQGLVAATVDRGVDPGNLVLFSPGGANVRAVAVGAGPDMVTFTHDDRSIVVANEGEPTGYLAGDVDPPGTISVVDVVPRATLTVDTVGFVDFDAGGPRAAELPSGLRVFGSPLPSLDLEPEYVTISADDDTAWVSLQENNAIAVLDLATRSVVRIDALGLKDHSSPGNGLDGSDQDGGINIAPRAQLFGMYQPDALAAFSVDGQPFLLSANDGDAREYPGLVEAARLRSTTTDASFGPSRANNLLGRLNVTTSPPGTPTNQTLAYAFGTRSFAVWDGDSGALVHDSGDDLEQLLASALPANFNSNNTANNFDNRSDDKGPEPEAAAVGVVGGTTYGFIGLERIGGVVVIDLSDPAAPTIVDYVNNRSFADDDIIGPDSGPEIVTFIDAGHSPTGRPLLVVSNEITGTISLYTIG
jgi:LVIVD repeat